MNAANNETSNATTDSSGAYSVPFLRPGDYKLTVTANGFKQYTRENVVLEVGRIVGIDVTLEVGAVTESINVTAEAAMLETQTASRVGVVNTMQVNEIPLNSRNPFMLGSMMSGVNFRGAAIWQRPFDNGAIAEWSVNGGRQSNNEFLMDGAPNNAQMGSNNIAYVPPVDSVQEFSVQQNSYDAQYGKTGGGVFNVVLKSGGSQHHGTAYEFMRRKWMDANTFQNNSRGAERPAHRLDQYGFQLDGPVYFPKLLKKDGAVKLFYMGQWEGYYEEWPQFLNTSYPEAEMRTGDFSKLVTAAGQQVLIYDPIPTGTDASGNPVRMPFANNIIPSGRLNPVALAVSKYMPATNTKRTDVRYGTNNVVMPNYAATDDFYNLTLKFDWNFGDKHRAFIRHASNDRTEDRCDNSICEGPGQSGQQPFQRINDAYVLDWLWTATPTTVLNLRASSNRFIEKGFGRANDGFDLTSLGLPSSLVSQLPGPTYFGRWEIAGYTGMGRYQSINITNSYNLMGNLTKIVRSHTMKMGIDLRRTHYIQQNSGNILLFSGQAQWTQRLWNQAEPTAGDGYASFLLGGIGGSSNYPLYPFFRQWYFAPYFQDDWKVSRRLTVNLGLRWDLNMYPDEKYNRINRGFNPTVASPVAAAAMANIPSTLPPGATAADYANVRNLKGGLEFAGVNGVPTKVGQMDYSNFQPRIGAAYQLFDKTVLRGGYGLYFTNFANNNDWIRTDGFSTNTPIVNSLDGGRTLIPGLLQNPYPSGINTPAGASRGYNTFVGQNPTWFDPSMRVPFVHQFSFGIQRQISNSSTLEVSYVGSRSVNLSNEQDYNIPNADFQKRCDLLQGGNPQYCLDQLPNPFRGIEAFRGTDRFSASNISRWELARPFPQYNGRLLRQGEGSSKIWYNSLQVNYNARVGRSLTLLGNYTFSKMVERWGYTDPFRDVAQQGLYFSDRPHFFKFSTVWELPFGRGKAIGGNVGGFANKLIGGWQFSTFTQFASGEPNNLPGNVVMLKDPRTKGGRWTGEVDWKQHQVYGFNNCVLRQFNDGSIAPTAASVRNGCGTDMSNYAWLRVADFTMGQGFPGGNQSRLTPNRSGQIRKQPFINADVAFSKTTQITERVRFQFRAEAFNLTNYYFFGRDSNFDTNPDNDNFGSLFPRDAWIGNGYPRQVQLGFKVYW